MNKYLAMQECPMLGMMPVGFLADDDRQAEDMAFEESLKDCYVTGGYDLYRIVWNNSEWKHELVPVVPEEGDEE